MNFVISFGKFSKQTHHLLLLPDVLPSVLLSRLLFFHLLLSVSSAASCFASSLTFVVQLTDDIPSCVLCGVSVGRPCHSIVQHDTNISSKRMFVFEVFDMLNRKRCYFCLKY